MDQKPVAANGPQCHPGGYGGYGGSPAGYPPPPPAGYPAAPPPGAPGGMPVAYGQAPQCRLSRQDLDQYLQQSGYGSNAAMFNCYFTRNDPNGPPLCINCRQPIAFHADGSAPAAGGGGAVGVVAMGQIADDGQPPSGLMRGDNEDKVVVDRKAYFFIFFLLLVIGLGQLIGFIAGGIVAISAVVLIAPCILLVFVLVISFATWRTAVTIQTDENIPLEQRIIQVESYRIITSCCPRVDLTTWSEIDRIEMQIGRTKRSVYGIVTLRCRPDIQVPLYIGGVDDAEREAARWRRYFGHA